MDSSAHPRLIKDSLGERKIKISLPGGRYQLSLEDRGVILLDDRLGYTARDTIPDVIVRILVATGDAWFPNQRDYQSVIADLPETTPLPADQKEPLIEFVRSLRVPKARLDVVQAVIAHSELADEIDPGEISLKELPTPPNGIFGDDSVEDSTVETEPTEETYQPDSEE